VREGQLLNLRGLDRGAVKGPIEALSGVVPSEAKVAAIHATTEGNPLFVREAVRLLAAEATLDHPGREGVPIPGSVRAVIQRRLPGQSGHLSAGQGELPAGRRDQQEARSTRTAGARRTGLWRAAGRGRPGQPVARCAVAEALGGLRPQDSPLHVRLLARLSLEFTFSDETNRTESLSRQTVAMAHRLADPVALRSALGAWWMAVWGPDGLDERTALAEEILRLARETGDREMELDGHASRAASALEWGDVQAAQAAIAAHARLAEELRMPLHQWAAMTMRATRALLHGSFEEAERLAKALPLQPRRPNVMFTHLDQLALLHWEQGRLDELRDEWQGVVDQIPRAAFAKAWLSLADAELGDSDGARRGLRLLAEQIPQRPRNGIWLPAVALASVLSAHLNEPDAASSLYPVLLPYAGHIIAFTAPQPVVCLGSASFYLALLATVTARWAEAADHFEAAIGAHDRLGPDRSWPARATSTPACCSAEASPRTGAGRSGCWTGRLLLPVPWGWPPWPRGSRRSERLSRAGQCRRSRRLPRPLRPRCQGTRSAAKASTGLSPTKATSSASRTPRDCATWPGCWRILGESSMRPSWRRPKARRRRRRPWGQGVGPKLASCRCGRTWGMRGSCWTPPPRRPTRFGWRSCGRSWMRQPTTIRVSVMVCHAGIRWSQRPRQISAPAGAVAARPMGPCANGFSPFWRMTGRMRRGRGEVAQAPSGRRRAVAGGLSR
jgi:hypothetical protein